jgi:hypothetical protein
MTTVGLTTVVGLMTTVGLTTAVRLSKADAPVRHPGGGSRGGTAQRRRETVTVKVAFRAICSVGPTWRSRVSR